MIEAAMIWNEPNNKSHWDPALDPGWVRFAEMAILAGQAIRAEAPAVARVLGGISPIDPAFIENMARQGVLDNVDALAVHVSRSTGTSGRSTNGPRSSRRSRRSPGACRSG